MSRLLENSNNLRQTLKTRNLYSDINEYDGSEQDTIVNNVINSISGIINPFSAFDFSSSIIGRLTLPNTPIQQIGNQMLAKQFQYTVASNSSREFLPTINLNIGAIKNGNIFELKTDFQITRRDGGTLTKLGNFISRTTGNYPDKSPFNQYSTNVDYIKNTGDGQLRYLNENLNRNLYQPSSIQIQDIMSTKGFPIKINRDFIFNKNWIPTNEDLYPDQYFTNVLYRNNKFNSYELQTNGYLEYNYNSDYVKLFGRTRPIRNEGIDSYNYGFNNDNEYYKYGFINQKNKNEKRDESLLLGTTNDEFFGIEDGLLKYTKALVDASQGNLINLTNKRFYNPRNTDEFIGYNGSGVYEKTINTVDNHHHDGIRQHNFVDPYGSFIKAIRFNGNKIYNNKNNQNSVIYDSVMPKITPTSTLFESGVSVDNKNMMFSIENLAVSVKKDSSAGFLMGRLDDEYNTHIPATEIGNFGGRLMWFPPYDIRLTETAIAKRENTQFIGRNEPIYTYNNSERLATLSFKMLMDYPPDILKYRGTGEFHKKVSEFFVFGSDGETYFSSLDKLENELNLLLDQKKNENDPKPEESGISLPESFSIYFPNDKWLVNEDIINDNYSIDNVNNTGELNEEWYIGSIDAQLKEFFEDTDVETLSKYEISIVGRASKLFNGTETKANDYNNGLSSRRAESVLDYLNKTYKNSVYCKYNKTFVGSEGSPETYDYKDIEKHVTNEAKEQRRVDVSLKLVGSVNNSNNINSDKISVLEAEIAKKKQELAKYRTDIFSKYNLILDGNEKGFQSIEKDQYRPIFHSITPEGFHRRLTFLQQCMRQGKAIKSSSGLAANNSAFGKQPIQILRIGDFFHTKVVIDSIDFDYSESTWDLNPEGMGVQPMIVDISIQMRVIGGQSLQTPISILQNATTFNYYANSTYYDNDTYVTPSRIEINEMKKYNNIKQNSDNKDNLEKTNEEVAAEKINTNSQK